MAKASSPIRIQSDLMSNASVLGKLHHRSAAEQIEYWASIGQKVENLLDPESLLQIKAGLLRVKLEQVNAPALNADTVFGNMDLKRSTGELKAEVSQSKLRYQASTTHPGLLEQVDGKGKIKVGQFDNGVFKPIKPTLS
ncbi:ParD-like family protein [Limnobacter parvus]|uniref:ParD-like family protein n=1 Tax=Limnobacter parvus TaxID=2939690 RepID=A0ABT1XK34_9BURK|nr:ParD-like family protein [Limnobacter parvus]MCR2747651.1 ParD-like family protein [Limnobacter parvus]